MTFFLRFIQVLFAVLGALAVGAAFATDGADTFHRRVFIAAVCCVHIFIVQEKIERNREKTGGSNP